MKAVTSEGKEEVEVKDVQAPKILKDDDMIVKIASTAICGSDLHLYKRTMKIEDDYIIGHEPMGIAKKSDLV